MSPAAGWRAFLRLLAIIREDRLLLAMVVFLFLLDGLVVALHIGHRFAIHRIILEITLASPRLDLSHPMGLGASLGLFTLAMAVLLGILAFFRNRQPIYLCGTAAFVVVLAVTRLRVHVPVGEMIGKLLPINAIYPVSAPHIGEAIGLAAAGAALLALLAWGATISSVGHARLGVIMAATLVLLGLFAGGVDLIQALVYSWSYYLRTVLQVVEEGGELFVVSLALVLMAVAARYPRRIAELG